MLARKWIVTLLILSLVMSGFLAACGSGGGSGDNQGRNNTTTPSGDDVAVEEEPVEEEPLELTMVLPLFEEIPDMENDFWTEYQRRTNTSLEIEWVPSGDFGTRFDLILSSGDLPDVLWSPNINNPNLISAVNNGAFWEVGQFLGDFSNYPNLRDNSAPNAWRYVTKDGKIYGIPRFRPLVDQGIKIRKDWLDEAGLPIPTTLDEFADTMEILVANDPNRMGHVPSYGGTGIHPAFTVGFGAFDPVYNEEGGMIHYNVHPGYVDTVRYFRDLYARGVLPQEFSNISNTQAQELFESGQVFSYIRNIWRAWMFEQSIKRTEPDAEVIVIDLEGPAGPAIQLEPGSYGVLMLSHELEEEKVRRILDYFEYTNSEEFFHFTFFGIEGVHHELDENGYEVMTDQGNIEVGTSPQQPQPLTYNDWWKAYDKAAPQEYNEQVLKDVAHYAESGKQNPFAFLISDTWIDTWPRYQNEWESMVIQAIVGAISFEEFEEYIEGLRNIPEFREAFLEFAEAYDDFMGN